MINPLRFLPPAIVFVTFWLFGHAAAQQTSNEIPAPLQVWKEWAIWDDTEQLCPTPYQDPEKHLCFWPSRLTLDMGLDQGAFDA